MIKSREFCSRWRFVVSFDDCGGLFVLSRLFHTIDPQELLRCMNAQESFESDDGLIRPARLDIDLISHLS